MSNARVIVAATLALLVITAIGCQSTPPASTPSVATQRAVVVTGGQSGAITVFIPNADNTGVEMLTSSTSKAETCSDCKRAIEAYFRTGAPLSPKCATCGATRTPVTLTTPYVSHN